MELLQNNPFNWWYKSSRDRYRSQLGYTGSTFYDYSKISYSPVYSNSFVDPENIKEVNRLLTTSHKAVRDIVVILDLPFKVKIHFSDVTFVHNNNGDDCRHLFLATKVLDEKELSDSEKIDVLCGVGVHEASHLKYSEIRVFESFLKTLKLGYNNKEINLICLIFNVLEDERVEDKLLKDRPGYLAYITSKKTLEFNKLNNLVSTITDNKLFYKIIMFIRYRDMLSESDLDLDSSLISNIQKKLELVYDTKVRTKQICSLSEDLFRLINDNLHLSSSDCSRILNNLSWYMPLCSGVDGIGSTEYLKDLSLDRKFVTDSVSSNSLRLIESVSEEIILVPKDNHYFINIENYNVEDDDYIYEGDPSINKLKEEYNNIKDEVSKYISIIRKLVVSQTKDYDFVIRNCRYGLLDTTKLAEAYQGVPQVYQRMGHVTTSNLAICILIDESGSMSGPKILAARKAAILLNESFSGIPGIDLFIYGHTADRVPVTGSWNNCVCVTIYKEKNIGSSYNLVKISAKCENRDGSAILDVAERIRKFTSDYCLMFVISDGEPSADSYRGEPAIKDTRSSIVKAEKLYNLNIIGICIDTVYCAERLYDNYLDLNYDLSNFPKDLGVLIKNLVLNTRKTITS